MILATLRGDGPDGRLIRVSPDRKRYALPPIGTMQQAIQDWSGALSTLGQIVEYPHELDIADLAAPLPRAWQWLDGSAFPEHGRLMQHAFGLDPIDTDRPLMYQGMSNRFYGPCDDVSFASESHHIDFEGEFGVITDRVPMGTSAREAIDHIKLLVQINDWSLRAIAPVEMKTGFGWIQAKPACSMAPFAVTPDELGDAWRDGRICLDLDICWNGRSFGHANGAPMQFGFHDLIAHAALTRELVAGTVIGSGTVSNETYAEVGSSCISEVRAIEMIAHGNARTGYMQFGDTVTMEARAGDRASPFGKIDQRIVPCT